MDSEKETPMRIFTAIKITTTTKSSQEFLSEIYICTKEFIVKIRRGNVQRGKKKHKLWKIALLRKQ